MRKLPAAAQEERRRQVVGLRESGLTFAAIAAQTGLTENGVSGICRRYAECGMAGLASGPRGPASGTGRFLTPRQEAEVQALVCRHLPDDLGLPYALWSRAAVRALVAQRCGVRLAVRSVGTYLARWGFTAQKPLRRAYEQSPEAVQRWLSHDYPAIAVRAKREKGAIFWGDETSLRSDDVRGRSFAPRGRTPPMAFHPASRAEPSPSPPVVRPSQRRARLGLVSALTNKGELRWMLLDGAIKAPTLIRFMQRLVEDAGRKVFLILDNLPVHRARAVQDWLTGRRAEIEVFHLPAYSPELNPDEGLNADLKQAATRKPPARSKDDLKRTLVSTLRSLLKRPDRIRSYFGHRTFRYAA